MITIQRELYLLVLAAMRAYRASLSHNEKARAQVDVIIREFEKVYR